MTTRTGALIALLSLSTIPAALAQSGNPGMVNFSRLANSSLDPYTNYPTTAQEQWFAANFARMGVFSPYFDAKTAWYTGAQVYQDSYALYVGSALASQHPEWILRDQYGNPLYIPWGCSNGTCPQYAADIANPNFRAWWIAQMQQIQSQGNYRGLWIDDVNMNFTVSDGWGNFVVPIDDSTGQPMTAAAWRNYFAQFLMQIRQAFPNKEILHNAPWFSGPDGIRDADPSIQQEIAAADIINIERGIGSDKGLTGGTGMWSIYQLFAYVDRVHATGRYVVLEDYEVTDEPTALYSLAGYYLISSGYDYYGDASTTPANWWNGFNTNLGAPLGPRTYSNGIFRRNFSNGIVLLGEPGLATQTVMLPGTFTTIDGATVSSVSLSGSQGIILLGTNANSTPALALNTTSLPAATAGTYYVGGLSASGGSGSYTFSLSGAPAGLGISGTSITGTLSTAAAGTYNVLVTAKDRNTSASAQHSISFTVNPALSITNTLPPVAVNAPYAANLTGSGGSGNYSWSVVNQPAGLTINGSTLAGTTTTPGTWSNVVVTMMDTVSALSVSKTFSVTVGNALSALTITTTGLPSGAIGKTYSATLAAAGGSGKYSWSAVGLPAGIGISGSTISGTPASAGSFNATVTVTDTTTGLTALKTFPIAVYSAPAITTASLSSGTAGTAYSVSLSATGGSGSYSWSATGLPAGLTLSGSTISGTPTAAGTFSIAVTVADPTTGLTAQKTFSVTIYSSLSITTATLPSGMVGVAYSASLAAAGGTGNYAWSATGLPGGLALSGSTIGGTPTAAGTFNALISAKDSSTGLTAQKAFSITTTTYGSVAIITSSTLPGGTVGALYSATLAATGGSGNYSWSATGLPAGLSLTGSTITGFPAAPGTYTSLTVRVKDTSTGLTAKKTFLITISSPLVIATSSLASCSVGTAYSAALAATGGSGNYLWAAAALPAGLSVSGSNIAGTSTASGSFSPIVTVSDTSTGLTSQKTFSLSCTVSGSGTWIALSNSQIAGQPAIVKASDGTVQAAVLNINNSLGSIAQTSGYVWQSGTGLGGYITSNPAIAVNNNAGVEAFVRGGDNAVWTLSQSSASGSFGNWSSLGGQISSDPFVLRSANGALKLFALATNQTVWETAQSTAGGAWSAQPSLGGSIAGKPVAVTNTDGTIEVFARGTDSALWHTRQSSAGGAWGGWASLGGTIAGDPSVAIDPDGRVEVFVVGTDQTVWHLAQTSGASATWTSWNGMDGFTQSNATVATDADGRIELYVRGGDNTLWYRAQTSAGATTWTAWASLGGNIGDAVAAATNGAGTITLFARGADNIPRARTQTAPGIW